MFFVSSKVLATEVTDDDWTPADGARTVTGEDDDDWTPSDGARTEADQDDGIETTSLITADDDATEGNSEIHKGDLYILSGNADYTMDQLVDRKCIYTRKKC